MTEKKKLNYSQLSKELQERIVEDRAKYRLNPHRTNDEDAIRRNSDHDRANLWRPAYVRDNEKILHLPYYNRYADKTQEDILTTMSRVSEYWTKCFVEI